MAQPTVSKLAIKAILFDFMGTCLDWHSSIISALPIPLTSSQKSEFALQWRQEYFDACAARIRAGEEIEDIDITHRYTLLSMLSKNAESASLFTEEIKEGLIKAWHDQKAWDDVAPALEKLRERDYEVYVHANGSTRLQLDIVRSSGLKFDMLFSSQILGCYKPTRENYERCLELLKLRAEECVTVAAHAYDLRGAKKVGMKTIYVWRWTDDVCEDQEVIKGENDAYLEGMEGMDRVIASL